MSSNLESDADDRLLEILGEIRSVSEKISDKLDHQTKQLDDMNGRMEDTSSSLEKSSRKIVEIRRNDKMFPIVIGISSVTGSIIGSLFGPLGSIAGAAVGLGLSSAVYTLKK